MKTKRNKRHFKKTYKNRFKRGGFFGPFKRQLTTQEDLENLKMN